MKGSHNVIVETEHMKYTFTIRRNITIVLGDSGTGKTSHIANYYLSNRCINKILEVIPEDIRKYLVQFISDQDTE